MQFFFKFKFWHLVLIFFKFDFEKLPFELHSKIIPHTLPGMEMISKIFGKIHLSMQNLKKTLGSFLKTLKKEKQIRNWFYQIKHPIDSL